MPRLKRPQVLCRGQDETRDRRAETQAEVLCRSPERERGSTLLWRYPSRPLKAEDGHQGARVAKKSGAVLS